MRDFLPQFTVYPCKSAHRLRSSLVWRFAPHAIVARYQMDPFWQTRTRGFAQVVALGMPEGYITCAF